MEDNKNIEQIKQQGWEDMSALLDTHMPQKDQRRMVWWYWLAGAAAVLLAVVIPLTISKNEGSVEQTALTNQHQIESSEDNQSSVANNNMKGKSPIVQPSQRDDVAIQPHGKEKTTEQLQPFTYSNMYTEKGSNKVSQSTVGNKNPAIGGRESVEAQKSNSGVINEIVANDKNVLSTKYDELMLLGNPYYMVEQSERSLVRYILEEPAKIEVVKSSGKVNSSVFSEMMWSLSDRFGFVSAGPGVHYAIGKWTLGLSAGLAVPLPRQKAFYAANLPFSKQYNFGNALDNRYEMNSPGLSASGAVYYERYTMNPGFLISVSTQRQIVGRWGIGVDLGRIGFHYDFTQKAEPNPNFAASTELTGIRNSLWYGGLSVNYQLGRHWMVHGGIKMINVLNAGDVGMLPGVRLEYGF